MLKNRLVDKLFNKITKREIIKCPECNVSMSRSNIRDEIQYYRCHKCNRYWKQSSGWAWCIAADHWVENGN